MSEIIRVETDIIKLLITLAESGNKGAVITGLKDLLGKGSSSDSSHHKNPVDVVLALFRRNDKYLVARRKAHRQLGGLWEFPGGRVEDGETDQIALRRELREEMDITVEIGHLLAQSTYQYSESNHVRLRLYACKAPTDKLKLIDHDAVRWLPLDEIGKLPLAPADRGLLFQLITAEYYEKEGLPYVAETLRINISEEAKALCLAIDPPGSILDIGCGSGRDTRYFMKMGYKVTPTDASPVMASLASEELGIPVKVENIFSMDYTDEFDGVWASASLLHLPKSEMPNALFRISKAIKPGGAAYFSLKVGDSEGLDDVGRYLSRYRKSEIEDMLQKYLPGNQIVAIWESKAIRTSSSEKWLNVIFTKEHSDFHNLSTEDEEFMPPENDYDGPSLGPIA